MRILYLGNNWGGWQIIKWLKEQGEEIVGLVIHPPDERKYGKEIIAGSGIDGSRVFDGSQLRRPEVLAAIQALQPDVGISVLFGYILRSALLNIFPEGCINLHPAFLPYNRGAYPNVWSIVEGTPAGVTMHYIDPGIDTGDIIAQERVLVEPIDTGGSLYRKLEQASIKLFKNTWPLIRSGKTPHIPHPPVGGTYHRTADVKQIDEIDLDRTYTARELIDIIRARTFVPYPGAYFKDGNRKIFLRLDLLYEQEVGSEDKGNDDCN